MRVTLIERGGRLGAEASHAAGGMLAPQAEADYRDAFFDLASASRDLYPAFAAALLEETGIDIELDRTGTLYLAFTEKDEAEIEHRYDWQQRAGLSVERLSADEARSLETAISPRVRLALRFPLDGQVENRRLVTALAASAARYGVSLLTGTEVTRVRVEAGIVRGVETSRGFVSAGTVIIAGGAWTSFITGEISAACSSSVARKNRALLPSAIEPVRGQMLCFEARPPLIRHVLYTPRGYLVPRRDGRLLAGSTAEQAGFDKSVTGRGIHTITTHALEIAPRVGDLPLVASWAGLRPRADDDLPVIGACTDVRGLYYATGHYRNGILLAPITGEMIADLISGGAAATSMVEAFTPERFGRTTVS